MTASRSDSTAIGWSAVFRPGSDLAVDLPVAVLRYLQADAGDRVFYLVEDEGTVLAYHERDVPDESERIVGVRTVTEQSDGRPTVRLTSTALTLLDAAEDDHIYADDGPGESARLHHSPGRPDAGRDVGHEADSRTRDEIPEEHLNRVPEDIDWTNYAAYHCRFPRCNDPCLNRVDSPYSLTKTCRACFAESDLDDLDVRGDHLPEWAKSLDPADQTTASEGEGEPARPAAQPAGEQPEPDRERPERAAPTRPAGSAPLRGDPEARAHPPNPVGEGDFHGDTHQPESEDRPTEQGALE
ncbi:hypothetical protein GRX03_05815 [Halovenus sp. WSH3]|uniref:Uncharacterized protein n=1 Tax=Halovenus carboxidivorans TaxID=2692199 RepID=A0A6B0T6B9_9EURY|nr:hypothetical protein [Halovenus carboxidivorans]MXR51123.1 hypothetical protein [Halovenus carboxidivorans]